MNIRSKALLLLISALFTLTVYGMEEGNKLDSKDREEYATQLTESLKTLKAAYTSVQNNNPFLFTIMPNQKGMSDERGLPHLFDESFKLSQKNIQINKLKKQFLLHIRNNIPKNISLGSIGQEYKSLRLLTDEDLFDLLNSFEAFEFPDVIEYILSKRFFLLGISPCIRNSILIDKPEIRDIFLKYGADFEFYDLIKGRTTVYFEALDISIERTAQNFKKIIQYKQALKSINVKSCTIGDTVLYRLINNYNATSILKELILLLIGHGANPYIKIKYSNKNAFDLALEKFGSDFVKQMEEAYTQFKKNRAEHLVAMISTRVVQKKDQLEPYCWKFPIDIARLIVKFVYGFSINKN